jgi:hypothetical protein
MERSREQLELRGRFFRAFIDATYPMQEELQDREVTLELMIEAADMLKESLENELEQIRFEAAD